MALLLKALELWRRFREETIGFGSSSKARNIFQAKQCDLVVMVVPSLSQPNCELFTVYNRTTGRLFSGKLMIKEGTTAIERLAKALQPLNTSVVISVYELDRLNDQIIALYHFIGDQDRFDNATPKEFLEYAGTPSHGGFITKCWIHIWEVTLQYLVNPVLRKTLQMCESWTFPILNYTVLGIAVMLVMVTAYVII